MSKIEYTRCDICGEVLSTDPRIRGFRNGFKFKLRNFFSGSDLDICDKCLEKLEKLSIDVEIETAVAENVINKAFEKYHDADKQTIYLEGVQDALEQLTHHRLNKKG